METRPVIALILRVLIFAALQFLAYKTYGVPILVVAWVVVVISTWIDVKPTVAKISQTVVQTGWFIFILAVIHMNQIKI